MLDQETETSRQIDISVARSSKYPDKTKNQIKDWRDLSKLNEKK